MKRVISNSSVAFYMAAACSALFATSYTQSVWSRLQPDSLQQYLSFIQLYPESEEAGLARSRLVDRLGLPAPQVHELYHLGPALVDQLLHPPETQVKPLPEAVIQWVENVASRELTAVAESGRSCKSLEELTQLDPKLWDITQVTYLCSLPQGGHYDAEQSRALHAKVDLLALCAKLALKSRQFVGDTEKALATIEAINRVIFEEQGFAFPSLLDFESKIDAYTSLPSLIDSKRGVCLGVSVLYMALAQRLGLDLVMVTPPGHIFVRWTCQSQDGPPLIRNIETTAYGMQLPDDVYRPLEARYMLVRELRELPGLVLVNQASGKLGARDFKGALRDYRLALAFIAPQNRFFVRELAAYAAWFAKPQSGGAELVALWHEYRARVHASSSHESSQILCFDPLLLQEVSTGVLAPGIVESYFLDRPDDLKSRLQQLQDLEKSMKTAPSSRWLKLQYTLAQWQLGRSGGAWSSWPSGEDVEVRWIYIHLQLALDCSQYSRALELLEILRARLDLDDQKLMTPFYQLDLSLHQNFFATSK